MLPTIERAGFTAFDTGGASLRDDADRLPLFRLDMHREYQIVREGFPGNIARPRAVGIRQHWPVRGDPISWCATSWISVAWLRSGLQALYFLSDDAVALAGGRFETLVVENPDYAPAVLDQTGGLEYAQGYGDSGPARTQHHRQELMAERNVVVIDAIARHEEPPREPLLNFVRRVLHAAVWDIWISSASP